MKTKIKRFKSLNQPKRHWETTICDLFIAQPRMVLTFVFVNEIFKCAFINWKL